MGGALPQRLKLTSTLLGQNVLREEIVYFGDWDGAPYNLTEAEKRLLTHAREDIASTHSLSTAVILQAIIIFMLSIEL